MDAIRNPVLRFVVHGHVLLAVGAALQVGWLAEQWLGHGSLARAAAAFSATTGCYGLMRLLRAPEDGMREVPLFQWYLHHRKAGAAAIGICFLVALMLVLLEEPGLVPRLWPVIIPALLYVVPFRGKDGRPLGLRWVPGLKSFAVAWVWSAGTVLLAADEADAIAWMLVAVQFGFFLAITIAFDLRDLYVDPPRLRTIPQVIGRRSARILALLLLLPLAAFLYVGHWMESIRWATEARAEVEWSLALPLVGLVVPAALILRADPERGWLHWLLLDACIALFPLLGLMGGLL